MAWLFDEVDDRVVATDDAALTLPDGDWTISGWFKLTDNTGTTYQYLFSWGTAGANPSASIYVSEASEGFFPNRVIWLQNGNDTTANQILSNATPGTDTNWHHVLVQRSGSVTSMYVDGSLQTDNLASGVGGTNVAGNLFFGGRTDLDANRFFGGSMAEWAKFDRAVSADVIASLAAGWSPETFRPTWYVRMQTSYVEHRVPLTLTNSGSVYADHPRIIVPDRPKLIVPAAAASASRLLNLRRRAVAC